MYDDVRTNGHELGGELVEGGGGELVQDEVRLLDYYLEGVPCAYMCMYVCHGCMYVMRYVRICMSYMYVMR
jgi:hypothetical protein